MDYIDKKSTVENDVLTFWICFLCASL